MPVKHLGDRAARVDQHQLGRSATDVENQRGIVTRLDQGVAAEDSQTRFLLGGDDVEVDAGFLQRTGDKGRAVRGAPARLGRDRARQRDVAALQLVGANAQRSDRAFDRGIRQLAARRQSFTQAHDAREGVNDGKAAALRPRDQQPAIVGPQVQRGKGLRIRPPPPGGAGRSRTGRRLGLPVRPSGGNIPHRRISLFLFCRRGHDRPSGAWDGT